MSYFVMCEEPWDSAMDTIYMDHKDMTLRRRDTAIRIRGPFISKKAAQEHIKQMEDDTYLTRCCTDIHFLLESEHVTI